MAYVTVPKDLTKVKSKVVFGLTKRQLICFGGALLIGVPLFFLIRGRVPTSAAALIMVFAMLPGFLLALYEKHGQPLEVVVRQIVECCFIQPKERPYQTNNAYTALVRQSQMEKEVNAIVQKAKERNERKSAGQAHPRRKERDSGRHPKVCNYYNLACDYHTLDYFCYLMPVRMGGFPDGSFEKALAAGTKI